MKPIFIEMTEDAANNSTTFPTIPDQFKSIINIFNGKDPEEQDQLKKNENYREFSTRHEFLTLINDKLASKTNFKKEVMDLSKKTEKRNLIGLYHPDKRDLNRPRYGFFRFNNLGFLQFEVMGVIEGMSEIGELTALNRKESSVSFQNHFDEFAGMDIIYDNIVAISSGGVIIDFIGLITNSYIQVMLSGK